MDSHAAAHRIGALAAITALGGAGLIVSPATASAATPIIFELEGTFGEGVLASYIGANDEPEVATVSLPWSTSFDYNGSARSLTFTGSHPSDGSGSITCRVSVGGRTTVSHTDNLPTTGQTGATCNIVDMGHGYVGN